MVSEFDSLVARVTIEDLEPNDIREVFKKSDREYSHGDKKKVVSKLISNLDAVKAELDQKCPRAGLASNLVRIIKDQANQLGCHDRSNSNKRRARYAKKRIHQT